MDPRQILVAALEPYWPELQQWLLGFARVAPSAVLVPAFGLVAVPGATRVLLGLSLALAIAPGVEASAPGQSFAAQLLIESARGLPVAVSAAVALWVASMVGGLGDDLRGVRRHVALPNLEAGVSPLGALFAMLVAVIFLQSGGMQRIALAALNAPPLDSALPLRIIADLVSGIELAIFVAAPLIAATIVVEVALSLIARAAAPAHLLALVSPIRSFAVLAVIAILFERIIVLLGGFAMTRP